MRVLTKDAEDRQAAAQKIKARHAGGDRVIWSHAPGDSRPSERMKDFPPLPEETPGAVLSGRRGTARKAIKMHPSEPQLGRVLHCQTKTLQEGSLVIIK